MIVARSVGAGIRGLKSRFRPDTILLDDIQDRETALNPSRVLELDQFVRSDVLNLQGRGKLRVLATQTPICAEDFVEVVEKSPSWRTLRFPAVIAWPTDWKAHREDGLWAQYFRKYDSETADKQPHTGSRKFYVDHRSEMDEGHELFQPERFDPNESESGLQAIMDQLHLIGEQAFSAELQMKPRRFSGVIEIQPGDVLRKALPDVPELVIPDGYSSGVFASSDLNLSYAVSTTVWAFRPDGSSHLIWKQLIKCHVDAKLSEGEYNKAVYEVLAKVGKKLKSLGVDIQGWGIDGNGTPFDAVCAFARNSVQVCGIPAVCMAGRAHHVFSTNLRTRLRNGQNQTVLCGDDQERLKAGSGKKWIYWDSDFYRSSLQRSLLAEIGQVGSATIYTGDADEHGEFALQVSAERLRYIQHRADGRDVYSWTSRGGTPHDYLDSSAQAHALAANQGIGGVDVQVDSKRVESDRRRQMILAARRRKKIVVV